MLRKQRDQRDIDAQQPSLVAKDHCRDRGGRSTYLRGGIQARRGKPREEAEAHADERPRRERDALSRDAVWQHPPQGNRVASVTRQCRTVRRRHSPSSVPARFSVGGYAGRTTMALGPCRGVSGRRARARLARAPLPSAYAPQPVLALVISLHYFTLSCAKKS